MKKSRSVKREWRRRKSGMGLKDWARWVLSRDPAEHAYPLGNLSLTAVREWASRKGVHAGEA